MPLCFSPSLPVFCHCLPFSLGSSSTNAPLFLSISSSLLPLSPILFRIFFYKCPSVSLHLFQSSAIVCHSLWNLLLQMLHCFSPSLPVVSHCLPFSLESSSTNAPLFLSISSSLLPLSPILFRIFFYKCPSVSLHLFQSSAIVSHSL